MSDSNSPRLLPVEKEDDKEEITDQPVNPPQAVQENIDSSREISPERKTTSSGTEEKAEESPKEEEADKATVSSRESREKQIIAEGDDGFKTPTSSEHKIPAITDCPPAPKKPRPPPPKLKRKASPSGAQRSAEMDAAMEIESIFRPRSSQDNAEDDQQKLKKARKDEEHDRS